MPFADTRSAGLSSGRPSATRAWEQSSCGFRLKAEIERRLHPFADAGARDFSPAIT